MSLRVALLPSSSLGDGLIHAVIASNLQRNGCEVRYFHDGMRQLADFVDGYAIERVPDYDTVHDVLADTEVILYDSTAPFTVDSWTCGSSSAGASGSSGTSTFV